MRLQTIKLLREPQAFLDQVRSILRPCGAAYVSTPNVLTLAPAGARHSGNPWHVQEYRAEEFRVLCERSFDRVELLGLFHARRLRLHEVALRAGLDGALARLGAKEAFYDRLAPAISERDFALRGGAGVPLDRALDFLAVLR